MTDSGKAISTTWKGLQFITFVVIALTFSPMAHAQTDSLQYSEEIQQDSMVQYLTPLEYAFMMHEETPWMVKVNLLSITNRNLSSINLKAAFETRIGSVFSLNFKLSYSYWKNYNRNALNPGIEGRLYYNKKKQIRAGKSKNNLSGNYFSFGIGYTFVKATEQGFIEPVNELFLKSYIKYNVKWGIQRRFLNKGYVDFGLTTGIRNYEADIPVYYFSTFLDAGLAFAKDKQKIDRNNLCSVLRCYDSDRFLIKIDLRSIFEYSFRPDGLERFHNLRFRPNVSLEFKIGQLPISLNSEISFLSLINIETLGDLGVINKRTSNTIDILLEPRWYYNLKRRILKGKSGDGLSANYFGFGAIYRNLTSKTKGNSGFDEFSNSIGRTDNFYYLTAGVQRLLSKHFYFDANLKFGFIRSKYYQETKNTYNESLLNIEFGIKIGYRFF